MRARTAAGAVALSAALFALAFPPFGLRPLAFVCLTPLLLALRSGGWARAVLLAWLWAVLAAWGIAPSFPGSIAAYAQQPAWVGWLTGVALFSAMAAAYYMVFAAVYRQLVRRAHAGTWLLVAAAWVATELARGRLFTGTPFFIGNPWGLIGYTHTSGPLAQLAAAGGVYAISFVIAASNAALAQWWVARRGAAGARRGARRDVAFAALLVAASAVVGSLVLRGAPEAVEDAESRRVAIVQGNVAADRTWRSEFYGRNLEVYLRLTRDVLGSDSAKSVVWPEGSMNFFLEAEPSYLATIAALIRESGVELLAGGPSGEGDRRPPYFNSIFLLSPAGEIAARYDKQHLVPFSEYWPFAPTHLVRRQIEGARSFAHGSSPSPIDTRFGRAGILTCNEAMLPEVAGERVRAGAEVLVNPSNDTWIAGRGFAEHMFAVVSLRAIEQRRYLVRASTSGPSAIVDPWGRVLVRSDSFRRQAIAGSVQPLLSASLYGRIGDAFAAACSVIVLVALVPGARGAGSRSA